MSLQHFPCLHYRRISVQTDWHSTDHCFHTKHSNCPEYGRSLQYTFLPPGWTLRVSMEPLFPVNNPNYPGASLQDIRCRWPWRNTKVRSRLDHETPKRYIAFLLAVELLVTSFDYRLARWWWQVSCKNCCLWIKLSCNNKDVDLLIIKP